MPFTQAQEQCYSQGLRRLREKNFWGESPALEEDLFAVSFVLSRVLLASWREALACLRILLK